MICASVEVLLVCVIGMTAIAIVQTACAVVLMAAAAHGQ